MLDAWQNSSSVCSVSLVFKLDGLLPRSWHHPNHLLSEMYQNMTWNHFKQGLILNLATRYLHRLDQSEDSIRVTRSLLTNQKTLLTAWSAFSWRPGWFEVISLKLVTMWWGLLLWAPSLWLVSSERCLASDWSVVITWPRYRTLIGWWQFIVQALER